jgi:hypothetical protein
MTFDLTQITAAEVAFFGIFATLISSVASASAAIATTLLKGRMDAQLASVQAHRQFLLAEFRPYLDHLTTLSALAIRLREEFEFYDGKDPQLINTKINAFLDAAQVHTPSTSYSLALGQRRKYLSESFNALHAAEAEYGRALHAHLRGTTPLSVDKVRELTNRLSFACLLAHEAVQRMVFREQLGAAQRRDRARVVRWFRKTTVRMAART